MNAEEAGRRVTEWLRAAPEGDRTVGPAAVRVMTDSVTKAKNGWYVAFNAVGYLDGTDIGKGMIPIPVVLVPDDGGEISYAMEIMARSSGRDISQEKFTYWAEVVDSEFDKKAFPLMETPSRAILRWDEVNEREEKTGEVQDNPEYTPGPVWRGWPVPTTPAQKLRNYYRAEWIDHDTFARNLLECEVLVPLDKNGRPADWPCEPETARHYQIFSSTDQITAGHTRWLRQKLRILLWQWFAEEPCTSFTLDAGRLLQEQFSWTDAALNPGHPPEGEYPAASEEFAAEAAPQTENLLRDLTGEFELEFPNLLRNHLRKAAEQARDNGYELPLGECARYAEGFARHFQNIRGIKDNRPMSWPEKLAAHGLIIYYSNHGEPHPAPWTFGKFNPQWTPNSTFAWDRITGTYVGFALGEVRSRPENSTELGPLTKQLLTYTEILLRGLPPHHEDAALPAEFPPASRSDGWLSSVIGANTNTAAEPLIAALVSTLAGDGLNEELGLTYAQAAAHRLSGETTPEVAGAINVFGWLFRRLLDANEFPFPVHVRLHQLLPDLTDDTPAKNLLHSVLALRNASAATESASFEALGAGQNALSVLGRSLFTAAKFHSDPAQAITTAVTQAGNSALIAALTGAMLGARGGIPGLPADWIRAIPQLGAVENMAADAFWHFNPQGLVRDPDALADWEERYPRN